MAIKLGAEKYKKLNALTREYIDAVNKKAHPEELHCYLHDLLAEAVKIEITLEHLLEVLKYSSIDDSETEAFIDNVSKHYDRGVDTAKIKHDEAEERKKAEKKKGILVF